MILQGHHRRENAVDTLLQTSNKAPAGEASAFANHWP